MRFLKSMVKQFMLMNYCKRFCKKARASIINDIKLIKRNTQMGMKTSAKIKKVPFCMDGGASATKAIF